MRAYVIRRVLLVVPTLLILSMIVFLLVRFIPGDVIDAMQADFAFTAGEIDREALERKLGLDQPIPVQYARWLGDIVLAREPGPIPARPLLREREDSG